MKDYAPSIFIGEVLGCGLIGLISYFQYGVGEWMFYFALATFGLLIITFLMCYGSSHGSADVGGDSSWFDGGDGGGGDGGGGD